eukprot:scaffold2063_cov401-Prasinococcus_capsulatus_cf.AAC.4
MGAGGWSLAPAAWPPASWLGSGRGLPLRRTPRTSPPPALAIARRAKMSSAERPASFRPAGDRLRRPHACARHCGVRPFIAADGAPRPLAPSAALLPPAGPARHSFRRGCGKRWSSSSLGRGLHSPLQPALEGPVWSAPNGPSQDAARWFIKGMSGSAAGRGDGGMPRGRGSLRPLVASRCDRARAPTSATLPAPDEDGAHRRRRAARTCGGRGVAAPWPRAAESSRTILGAPAAFVTPCCMATLVHPCRSA